MSEPINNKNKRDFKKDIFFYALMIFVVLLFATMILKEWGVIANTTETPIISLVTLLLTLLMLAKKTIVPEDTLTSALSTLIRTIKGSE